MKKKFTFFLLLLCYCSNLIARDEAANKKIFSIKEYRVHDPGNDNGPGTHLPPQGNKINFYRDTKYSGMTKDFNYGVINHSSPGFLATIVHIHFKTIKENNL